MVADIRCGNVVEQLLRAVDFGFLDGFKIHRVHGAFSLCNEEDVLDGVLVEGDGPVGRIAADRRRDMETAGQLGIYADLGGFVQRLGKLLLDALLSVAVSEDVVLNALSTLTTLSGKLCVTTALAPTNHRSLLLLNDARDILDELLRIVAEEL